MGMAIVEHFSCITCRYYHTLVFDYRERLVEVSAHLLMILLDYSPPPAQPGAMPTIAPPTALSAAPPTQEDTSLSLAGQQTANENLFKLYISRLHQKEVGCYGCRANWVSFEMLTLESLMEKIIILN